MMLKVLIANWLKEQAQAHVLDVVRNSLEQPATPTGPLPPCEVAILFATAMEAGGTVDGLKERVTMHCASHVEHAGAIGERRVSSIETGHGQAAAAAAAVDAIRAHRPRWVISAGFASSLVDTIRRGHIMMATEVLNAEGQAVKIELHLDSRSLENNRALHIGRLYTSDDLVRTAKDRKQLASTHGALAVDLETWGAAEACRQAGIPFLSVRIMTETVGDELPEDMEKMLQQTSAAAKLGAAAGSVWRRPSVAKDLWRFNEDALKASDRLGRFLTGLVQNLPR